MATSTDRINHYGQCFLCTRELTLTRSTDSKGDIVYTCPRCGGMNSAKRVESNQDIRGSQWTEYGPRV
jgi:rRNA maturation endonuclease Nob1